MNKIEIKCDCGYVYCFKCGNEAHRPVVCQTIKQWDLKNTAESENVTWIEANTKSCPNCNRPIEKNQGCNHMTCRKEAGGCGHEFCWLCLVIWKEHGTKEGGQYACKPGDKEKQEAREVGKKKAQTELQRYMQFFERFSNHNKAQKLAEKSLQDIKDKAHQLNEIKHYPIGECMFLPDASDFLIVCRRVLKNIYAYEYYQPDTDTAEIQLFKNLKSILEGHTEKLHELIERDLSPFLDTENPDRKPFYEYKSEVTNYCSVTQRFLKNMLEGIESGLTQSF